MDNDKIEELRKKWKEKQHSVLLRTELLEFLGKTTGESSITLVAKIEKLSAYAQNVADKMTDLMLKGEKTKDFAPVINIVEQAEQMMKDIMEGKND